MRTFLVVLVTLGSSACILGSPDYDGTAFSCAEPPFTCPSGYVCEQGSCLTDPVADPAGPDAAPPAEQPDAEPTPVGDPPPDAQEPEVPGEPTTITLGERSGADIANVTRDSTIREDLPLDNFGTDTVFAPDTDPNQRGLLRIDTSAIPATAEVLAVELVVYVSNPIEEGQVLVHQLLEDWNEDQTNWGDRRTNQRWTAAGAGIGSHAAAVMGTLPVAVEGDYTMQLDVTVVQQWVSSPSTNHGMLWISSSTTGRGAELKSRDSSISSARPLLRVTYR